MGNALNGVRRVAARSAQRSHVVAQNRTLHEATRIAQLLAHNWNSLSKRIIQQDLELEWESVITLYSTTYGVRREDGGALAVLAAEAALRRLRRRQQRALSVAVLRARARRLPERTFRRSVLSNYNTHERTRTSTVDCRV